MTGTYVTGMYLYTYVRYGTLGRYLGTVNINKVPVGTSIALWDTNGLNLNLKLIPIYLFITHTPNNNNIVSTEDHIVIYRRYLPVPVLMNGGLRWDEVCGGGDPPNCRAVFKAIRNKIET